MDSLLPLLGEPTPLPWPQVLTLLVCRVADPLSFTVLFPFVYFMVKDFHLTENDGEVGFYVGFIASSFAVAQTMSGIPWGMLSDRIGRRPVILMGLVGTSISLFMFGLSKSLPWAIVTRSMCGLLSGNVGVIKSAMAELTDSTNRAKGFSLLPMAGGVGAIIGPVLGGFLANPVQKYPALFGQGLLRNILLEYPYLLPCALCSFVIGMSAITGYVYFEETHKKENEFEGRSQGEGGIFELPIQSWISIVCFGGMSFQTVVQSELVPLWLATPTQLGGLGFTSSNIGSLISFSGIALLAIQLTLYTPIHQRLGTLLVYRNSFLLYAANVLMFPSISFLADTSYEWLLWPTLLAFVGVRTGINVFIRTSANLMLVEACPDKRVLGKVNGISQTVGSMMKSLGPALCGLIFSWSLSNESSLPFLKASLMWEILSLIAVLNFAMSFKLSK
ncbi:hypothetical protein DSO57_1037539 [Entomophthora muscae]|uniref:Uncharacterized protein n=1 Tax=Entomophthora muscae TaxID=34485 RepID=A0ACC2TAC3_9FUNG|nr:hypothetical protein DSO57_1037539 [Entomophthora muscae]